MEDQRKILIVDDEKFVTDTLEGFFHNKGYAIFKAEDGQSCMEIIKKENLDLVLLDIKLPKIDGIEILRSLRNSFPRVKVIVMTAYDLEYKTKVDNIGCDAFFIKPLLIDELIDKVEELLLENKSFVQARGQSSRAPISEIKSSSIPAGALPKARILIVSPREIVADLLSDYFSKKEICGGIFEVAKHGLEQSSSIKKFQPDIILLDVVLVGLLGEFGLTLMKMARPPKEIILFGDPAVKWEEAETLIKRGTKFIEIPQDWHSEKYSIKETIQRLNTAVSEVCAKYRLYEKEGI